MKSSCTLAAILTALSIFIDAYAGDTTEVDVKTAIGKVQGVYVSVGRSTNFFVEAKLQIPVPDQELWAEVRFVKPVAIGQSVMAMIPQGVKAEIGDLVETHLAHQNTTKGLEDVIDGYDSDLFPEYSRITKITAKYDTPEAVDFDKSLRDGVAHAATLRASNSPTAWLKDIRGCN